MTPCRLV